MKADFSHQALTELLVLRVQGGREDAVGPLVKLWHERLLRHARRLTGRDDAAEDVLQEAWVDICRGLLGLEDPGRFAPWAYRIVTRRSTRWIRKQQRQRQVETAWKVQQPTASHVASEPADDDVDELRSAFRRLSAEQQILLELKYAENLRVDQIADILGVAAGTVKSRLFHARSELGRLLKKVDQ